MRRTYSDGSYELPAIDLDDEFECCESRQSASQSHTHKSFDAFNLFTHALQQQKGGEVKESYEELREAILELFLSVKIRSDDEIEGYNEGDYNKEKRELDGVSGFQLVDYTKEAIEALMSMKIRSSSKKRYKRKHSKERPAKRQEQDPTLIDKKGANESTGRSGGPDL